MPTKINRRRRKLKRKRRLIKLKRKQTRDKRKHRRNPKHLKHDHYVYLNIFEKLAESYSKINYYLSMYLPSRLPWLIGTNFFLN